MPQRIVGVRGRPTPCVAGAPAAALLTSVRRPLGSGRACHSPAVSALPPARSRPARPPDSESA
eukprot:726526-Alexandrium_andersonii.AAC.1